MKPAEQFMFEYLEARRAEARREAEVEGPFRQRFYASGCHHGSRKARAEPLEVVERVLERDDGALVVTRQQEPFPRLCYHLAPAGDSWRIERVDIACPLCGGTRANSSCLVCRGKGWL